MYPLILSALLAGSTPARADTETPPADNAHLRRLVTAMRTSGSARELALSTQTFDPDWESLPEDVLRVERGERLRKAAIDAPEDVIVQYLWSHADAREAGCDEARPCPGRRMGLARLQPSNGAAWVPVLREAWKAKDALGVDAAMAEMAAAERFDDLYVEAWLAWREILRRVPVTEAELRLANRGGQRAQTRDDIEMGMATANAALLPLNGGIQSLVHACDRQRSPEASEQRFEDCARAGRLMARTGTSMISEGIGHALVRRAGKQSQADREAERAYKWRQAGLERAYSAMEEGADDWRQYFADLVATRREARAQELLLARHGESLVPPAGWKAPE